MGSNITIDTLKELAISRGGKCLSTEYINSQTPVEWECENGHKWFAKPVLGCIINRTNCVIKRRKY